jgi:hypothetical protein
MEHDSKLENLRQENAWLKALLERSRYIYVHRGESCLVPRIVQRKARKAQAMRLPVWDKPRVIGSAENFPRHIALPRGCREDLSALLDKNGIIEDIRDERSSGRGIEVSFIGTLRHEQNIALNAILEKDIGVLKAPAGFGKTVVAAAIIAQRKVSTLILVHRAELLRQWKERLTQFLTLEGDGTGMIGGGKKKPKGLVDIALMRPLSRHTDLPGFLAN